MIKIAGYFRKKIKKDEKKLKKSFYCNGNSGIIAACENDYTRGGIYNE